MLFQEEVQPNGEIIHQPIAFASKRFSPPASNWDTFKREAYAIYHAVSSFSYYLRGKDFLVETDHANLQWIESSQSPIVIRWRSLLQCFPFLIRHLKGKENRVADWMTRMYRIERAMFAFINGELSFEELMQTVHGGKRPHFGLFDELVSDPGSALMSDVVKTLNSMFGVSHKVSLIGRHQSNGAEGSIKQFLRHLKTFVFDERLVERWSDSNVLALINFALNSRTTPETGGYTPFQLKYGTQDAKYFKLPLDLAPGLKMSETLKRFDKDLEIIRELSRVAQSEIVAKRRATDAPPAHYESGDLLLWNSREQPTDHLKSKLSPTWMGPYKVISQRKNDLTCIHVVAHTTHVLHIDRVKPFFGTLEEAQNMAKLDDNQYDILSINFYVGNPHKRTSMAFNVTFNTGLTTETVDLVYNADFACSAQFVAYVNSIPYLLPLRDIEMETRKQISDLRKLAITDVSIGDKFHVNLRYYDGIFSTWFEELKLPYRDKVYVVEVVALRWMNESRRVLVCSCLVFANTLKLTNYDMMTVATPVSQFNETDMILVTAAMQAVHPQIWV